MGLFFAVIVLAFLGWLLWWGFLLWLAYQTFIRVRGQLDPLLRSLGSELRGFSDLPAQQRAARQAQIVRMLTQANSQMGQLNSLYRQRYELQVGEMQMMAANAGIDWTPS